MNPNLEPILENILLAQSQKADETNKLLETQIVQSANIERVLENTLEMQARLEKATKKVELLGAEVVTIKGDKGDKGDKPTEEELTKVIKPLIPKVENGKDGRNPLTVSRLSPNNPQIGDLWYKI